tara:strand:+ start:1066 stop:2820 length:1755 start_codon:yes stop_codon:yes gene_type:complete
MADPTVDAIMNYNPNSDPIASVAENMGINEYNAQKKGFLGRQAAGFKQRFKEAEQSLSQLASMGFEGTGIIPEGSTARLTESIAKQREEYQMSPNSRGNLLGEVMADIVMTLPALAITGPAALSRVGPSAAIGGGLGMTRPVYSQDDINFFNPERMKNVTYSALAGGAGTAVVNKVLPYAQAAITEKVMGAPSYLARTRSLEGIEAQAAKEAVDAAKKFNTFVTPAEATRDAIAQGREARTFLFQGAKRKLANRLAERSRIVDKEMDKIMSALVPKGREAFLAARQELKDEVFNTRTFGLTTDDLLTGSPYPEIMRKAKGIMDSETGVAFVAREGGTPVVPGTIAEFDLMRRSIDTLIDKAKPKGKSIAALTEARRFVTDVADVMSPNYKILRNMNQQLAFRDKITAAIGKVRPDGSRAGTFYKEFMLTPEKFANFMRQIDNIQDASVRNTIKRNVTALRPLLKALHESPLESVMGKTGRYLEAKASGVGGITGIAVNQGSNMVSGALDKRIVDFITDPSWYDNWVAKGAKTVQEKNGHLMTAFYDYLAMVSPQTSVAIQQQALDTNRALEEGVQRQRRGQRPY